MADPPPGARAKIARAYVHFENLADAVDEYRTRTPEPYGVIAETNPEGPGTVYRLRVLQSVPDDIRCILGDFVHNLRSALDILVCDLARHNETQVTADHGFPIGASSEAFKSAFGRKVKGLGREARKAIKRLKPYQGGNDDFWILHKLDTLDKHSLLLTTVAAARDVDVTSSVRAALMRTAPADSVGDIDSVFSRRWCMAPDLASL